MSLLRRLHKTPIVEDVPTHAFCEPVSATATSYWHIREVGEEGIKLGGGIPNTVLCGSDRFDRSGWDLKSEVTVESVIDGMTPRTGDNRIFVCPECANRYLGVHGRKV